MDTFKFVMPAEISKGKDGEWKVSGLASTGAVDRQGETILPEGIDATPIATGKGFFNFDHDNSPESTIGILDGYKKTNSGMFVSGRLFKNHKKAQAVYEIMSSLGKSDKGRVGMSVEGKVIERDPFNPKIIKRCVVKNVAITMNPVNQDTYADIIKSFAGSDVEFDSVGQNVQEATEVVKSEEQPTFTATQVVQIVEKALGIGGGNSLAPAGRTGGDALSVSDMGEKPKKKKVKSMSKEMFKSQVDDMMNKLQVLYPESTREQIWTAVKDRLDTQYEAPEFQKGGPGSGTKGHVSAKKFIGTKQKYSWGDFRHIEARDKSHSVPIHPEHWNEIKEVHSGKKESGSFKDETGKQWKVGKHPEGGVKLNHSSSSGKHEHHLEPKHIDDLD